MVIKPPSPAQNQLLYCNLGVVGISYSVLAVDPDHVIISGSAGIVIVVGWSYIVYWMLIRDFTELYQLVSFFGVGLLTTAIPYGLVIAPKASLAEEIGAILRPLLPLWAALFTPFLFGGIALLAVLLWKVLYEYATSRDNAPENL